MRFDHRPLATMITLCAFLALGATAFASQTPAPAATPGAPHMTEEETVPSVPALDDLHEVVYEFWHTAFPAKDCDLIRSLLPRADTLTTKLDEAALPGILRDKQAAWDEGKKSLHTALGRLHEAAARGDDAETLAQIEAFHAAYERLVRTIRPVVPELDAFHRELYKLYHYYAPEYDVEKIRSATAAMGERLPALAKAQLPKRLADRQERFERAVKDLDAAVADLSAKVASGDREAILAAVERVHTAYQVTESVFE